MPVRGASVFFDKESGRRIDQESPDRRPLQFRCVSGVRADRHTAAGIGKSLVLRGRVYRDKSYWLVLGVAAMFNAPFNIERVTRSESTRFASLYVQ